MAFRLVSDAHEDRPILVCDVCGKDVFDLWNDRVTCRPEKGKATSAVVHHVACVPKGIPSGAFPIPLIEFLKLLVVRNRVGSIGSNASVERLTVEVPKGKRFEG